MNLTPNNPVPHCGDSLIATNDLENKKEMKRPKEMIFAPCAICGLPAKRHRKTCSKPCSNLLKSRTISSLYADGSLEHLKEKQRQIGTGNLINYNKSVKGRRKSSELTKRKNDFFNPVKQPGVKAKISKSLLDGYASGRIKNPMSNPVAAAAAGKIKQEGYRTGKYKHPMKNPELALQVSRSLKEGYASGKIKPPNILDGKRYKRGFYTDKKGQKHYYASGWELARMNFLDRQFQIIWKKLSSEYRIPYVDLQGNSRTYFPDFEVRFRDKIIVEEIGTFTDAKQHKIKIAEAYFYNRPETYKALGKEQLYARTWL